MTDVDTSPPRVRRTRPPVSEAARARRAAARQSRAQAAAAGPSPAGPPPAGPPPAGPPPAGPSPAGPSPAGPSPAGPSPAGSDESAVALDVTTELAPYVDSEPVAPPARARGRRVEGSLADLDARAAGRPFPDTSIGLNVFDAVESKPAKQPLLVRLLRLQHVRPTGWQRAAVGDVPILIAVLLVLADLATAWTVLVLPVVVLGLVKFHDIIESRLAPVPVAQPVDRPFGEAADG